MTVVEIARNSREPRKKIAEDFGISPATLSNWLKADEVENQTRDGVTKDQVEWATLEWVWWFKDQRLHSEIGNVPPIEIEQEYYAEKDPVLATASHGKP